VGRDAEPWQQHDGAEREPALLGLVLSFVVFGAFESFEAFSFSSGICGVFPSFSIPIDTFVFSVTHDWSLGIGWAFWR
jgi:hypothetical protein